MPSDNLAQILDAEMDLLRACSAVGRLSCERRCLAGADGVGPKPHRGTVMDHCVGIDVALEQSNVCAIDGAGQIVREGKVSSEPEALPGFLADLKILLIRVELEAGSRQGEAGSR